MMKHASWFFVSLFFVACAHHEQAAPLAQDFSEVEAEEAAIPPSPPLPAVPVDQRPGLPQY